MTLIRYNVMKYRGMSLMSLLLVLTLFNGIFLSISQWTAYQREKSIRIYQTLQAIQIAENQKQRLLFAMHCQNKVKQNKIQFYINCSSNVVNVHSSMVKIKL